MRKGTPVIRTALLFLLLLGSLTMVVWRQSRALAVLRELDAVRRERAVEEARLSSLERRVEHLESRARVSAAAAARFGMRLPTGEEIVILPLSPSSPAALAASVEGARAAEEGGPG